MKSSHGVTALGVAAVILVAIVAWRPVTKDPSSGARVGAELYTRNVDEIIRRRWLRVEDGVVRLTDEARKIKGVEAYFDKSFLAGDAKDGSLWQIDNGVIWGISGHAHVRRLPFEQRETWNGAFYFRPQREAVSLTSKNLNVSLADRSGMTDTPVKVNLLADKAARGSKVELYVGSPAGANGWVALLQRLGETVLVQTGNNSESGVKVSVNGRDIGNYGNALLSPGGQLTIWKSGRPFVLTSRGPMAPAISLPQPLGDRYHLAGLESFSLPFESAMDHAVAMGLPQDKRMTSSLDYGLQTALQRQLDSYAGSTGKRFAAAATVIDVETGEVLAAVTYPTGRGSGDPGEERSRNGNFLPIPVGSAAKVPISAAILAERPDLADLQIQGGPAPIKELFGLDLSHELHEEAPLTGQIDFNEFLKKSSNRYAASLALLAATNQPHERGPFGRSARYVTGDGLQTGLPPLAFEVQTIDGRPVVDKQNNIKLPWVGRLKDLFDVEYEQIRGPDRPGRYGDDLSDMTVWRDLLDSIPPDRRRLPPLLQDLRTISPIRVNFASNHSRSFRSDYLQMIIGGQDFSWTTIKLAESYARLVTGDMVQARLLFVNSPPAWPRVDPFLPPTIRTKLLNAMALPATSGGTARDMQPVLIEAGDLARRRGEEIRLYSKTGSPHLETPRKTDLEKAEDELITKGILILESGEIKLRIGRSAVTVSDDSALKHRLNTDPAGGKILKKYGVTAAAALARARRYNQTDDPGLYVIKNNVLVKTSRQGSVDGNDVKLYAFVIGRYPPYMPVGGKPLRALAMVVSIQNQWLDGNEAVIFARCVMPSTIIPALFEDSTFARPVTPECQEYGIR